jgi:hypothetical protein
MKRSVIDPSLLEDIIKRASEGDESTLPAIRMMLDEVPNGSRLLGGDLAHEAAQALIRAVTGTNVVQREALCRKMDELRSELTGPNPQPLEQLLVDRVVLCWLHVHYADVQYAYAMSVTLAIGDYLQRQQDRAQKRYLAAIRCLAAVRRLALPIKVDVTMAGTVESPTTGSTCRRRPESPSGATSVGRGARRRCVK